MKEEDGIQTDKLAVAMTRPTTKMGVPYIAFLLNGLVSLEALIWTRNVLWLGIFVPLHILCVLITLHDPRAFELLWLWFRTKFVNLLQTRWYWSGSSYSPLTSRARHSFFKRWLVKRRLTRRTKA